MDSLDLARPFIACVKEQHGENPMLRLVSDLKQVSVVLESYAQALGITVENLTVLHVCADRTGPHPHFIEHIESKGSDKKYIGQHISRLKKIIRNLPWPSKAKSDEGPKSNILEELLPPYIREIWFLLPRINGSSQGVIPKGERKQLRTTLPLSPRGLALGLALLQVSSTYNIMDVRTLLEERSGHIYLALREVNPSASRHNLLTAFCKFRAKVRAHLEYVYEKKQKITLLLEELSEPLQSQVRTYCDRARDGFKSDGKIITLAKTRYGLKLGLHSKQTIQNYLTNLLFGLGYISRDMSIQVADVRDLLKLQSREVEVDGVSITEQYNPLVECYRSRGLGIISDRKGGGFDSGSFRIFINGLTAVAAFNGFLHLRKLFLKEYKVTLDKESKDRHKKLKKETFGRPWLNEQIQRLKLEFDRIVSEGSFKNKPSGSLGLEARRNLNLCLFYVTLLALRYLGVRQQSIRDCKPGENIIFAAHKCIIFLWPTSKNGKGIRHQLNTKEHSDTHRDLIDAVRTFYKEVYPYISGSSGKDQTPTVREERRRRVDGQFFLCCALDGLCTKFTSSAHFYTWFVIRAKQFLDFEGEKPLGIIFNPHFLRAMFGDWLRLYLGFSKEQAANIAADSEEVFESEYITHPTIFDATDEWTKKNKEIRALRDNEKGKTKDALHDDMIKNYRDEMVAMRETIKTQAETIKQLTSKTR